MLVFLRTCPTGVIRGSLVSLKSWSVAGTSTRPLSLMKRLMNSR